MAEQTADDTLLSHEALRDEVLTHTKALETALTSTGLTQTENNQLIEYRRWLGTQPQREGETHE